jgi:hypothetical protein
MQKNRLEIANPKRSSPWIALLLAVPLGLVFMNCKDKGTDSGAEVQTAQVRFKTILDPVNSLEKIGVLQKASTISLSRLVLTSISSVGDTFVNEINSGTVPALNPTSSALQTLVLTGTLPVFRSWKTIARVYDSKDSLTHADSTTGPYLNPGDIVDVNMNLSSIYTQYEAKFANIPDSIAATAGVTVKQVLRLDRLTIAVDGVIVTDSTSSPAPHFAPHDTATLAYDYVKVGGHTITLAAYGHLGPEAVSTILFQGSTVISVGSGTDNTVIMQLHWVGPTEGGGTLTVSFGKIGKVTVIGNLPNSF